MVGIANNAAPIASKIHGRRKDMIKGELGHLPYLGFLSNTSFLAVNAHTSTCDTHIDQDFLVLLGDGVRCVRDCECTAVPR